MRRRDVDGDRVCEPFNESGDTGREDEADSVGEPSQCGLSEACSVWCLRGTGATMSCPSLHVRLSQLQ